MLTDLLVSGPRGEVTVYPFVGRRLIQLDIEDGCGNELPDVTGWAGRPMAAAISPSRRFLCLMSNASRRSWSRPVVGP